MSATGVSIIPDGYDAAAEAESRREKWWKRLAARYSGRCAARDCPYRAKLWPAWLRKPESILFEGHWYCEPGCLESAVEFRVRNLLSAFVVPKARNHRLPLGLLLLVPPSCWPIESLCPRLSCPSFPVTEDGRGRIPRVKCRELGASSTIIHFWQLGQIC